MEDAEKAARQAMATIPEADKAALYAPQNIEVFVTSVSEGFRPGSRGTAWDDSVINREWGFDLATVQPRIDIWHGTADVNVPVHAATYLHNSLPHTRLTLLPDAGHFALLSHWRDVLLALVRE